MIMINKILISLIVIFGILMCYISLLGMHLNLPTNGKMGKFYLFILLPALLLSIILLFINNIC